MPRYVVETEPIDSDRFEKAIALVATRYPEVVVEHRYVSRNAARHELWVCRAPSAAHVERWCADAHLTTRTATPVDDETVHLTTHVPSLKTNIRKKQP